MEAKHRATKPNYAITVEDVEDFADFPYHVVRIMPGNAAEFVCACETEEEAEFILGKLE